MLSLSRKRESSSSEFGWALSRLIRMKAKNTFYNSISVIIWEESGSFEFTKPKDSHTSCHSSVVSSIESKYKQLEVDLWNSMSENAFLND